MFGKKSGDLEHTKAIASGQIHVGRYIPFAVHTAPNVVKLKENGDLCATWRMHGIPFETAAPEQILAAKTQLVNFLHAIRGTDQAEPTALWVHRVRRKISDRLKGNFPSPFAQQLNEKYYDKLEQQDMLQNELYFTILLRPTHTATGAIKKMRTVSAEALNSFDEETHERFAVLCQQVSSSLDRKSVV